MTYYEEAMEMKDEMIRQRRDFHAHPETAWTEFRTTSLIAEELQKLGYEVLMGSDILDEGARMMVPDEKTLKQCAQRAIKEGANPVLVDRMKGGMTGAVWGSCISPNRGKPWPCASTSIPCSWRKIRLPAIGPAPLDSNPSIRG